MHTVVLIRHGESEWNKANRFCGWTDVGLSAGGRAEAAEAGRLLADGGYTFDVAYTSVLTRAIETLAIVLEGLGLLWIPVIKNWRLNERHYGALQGVDKKQKADEVGDEQVFLWRRSYDVRPPLVSRDDPRHPTHDPRYAGVPASELPAGECLKDTVDRFLPFWRVEIAPAIVRGHRVLIAAHGNSLRALVKYLDGIGDEEISHLNIPTGIPLVYELDDALHPVRRFYLGDPEKAKAAAEAVANQARQ